MKDKILVVHGWPADVPTSELFALVRRVADLKDRKVVSAGSANVTEYDISQPVYVPDPLVTEAKGTVVPFRQPVRRITHRQPTPPAAA